MVTRMEARFEGMERSLLAWRRELEERDRVMDSRVQRMEDAIAQLTELLKERRPGQQEESEPQGGTVGETGEQDSEVGQVGNKEQRWRKLDIPIFVGEDAFGWVSRLERYFRLKMVPEEEWMQAVMVALEGKALNWFLWWEGCNGDVTWK